MKYTMLLICLPHDQKTITTCASLCIHEIHCSIQTMAQYWVGEGRSVGVSAYQMGHCVTVTMEMRGQIVVKSVLQLQREGSL